MSGPALAADLGVPFYRAWSGRELVVLTSVLRAMLIRLPRSPAARSERWPRTPRSELPTAGPLLSTMERLTDNPIPMPRRLRS